MDARSLSFVDWSDPEAMLGLLIEWVGDERNAAEDPARGELLAGLWTDLSGLAESHDVMTLDALIARLRTLHEAGTEELPGDPALAHLSDCAAEMERLRDEA